MWYPETETAQTGFIFAIFGLGMVLLQFGVGRATGNLDIFFAIDPILYGAAVCYGLAMLYIRSGRTFAIFLQKENSVVYSRIYGILSTVQNIHKLEVPFI